MATTEPRPSAHAGGATILALLAIVALFLAQRIPTVQPGARAG